MCSLLVIVLLISTGVFCENPEEELRWMLMPDANGKIHLAILSRTLPIEHDPNEDIDFILYTRQNPNKGERRKYNETCRPVFPSFDPRRRTKILIHGFGDDDRQSFMYPALRKAFLARDDMNIIEVGWGKMARAPWYWEAAANTRVVGSHTAKLIDHLVWSTDARLADFHVVGFSLGAHAAGFTGKYVSTGRMERITGLDPAYPLFQDAGSEGRLHISDAKAVEVVHTSGGYLAFQDALGDVDFYPNGGDWPQPGCPYDVLSVCSHQRAYFIYSEAIEMSRGFDGTQCPSWTDYKAQRCRKYTLPMAFEFAYITERQKGNYYLITNSDSPYGIDAEDRNSADGGT